jgi:hypothetical protein
MKRGLHICLALTFLGAAPCFATLPEVLPTTVVLSGASENVVGTYYYIADYEDSTARRAYYSFENGNTLEIFDSNTHWYVYDSDESTVDAFYTNPQWAITFEGGGLGPGYGVQQPEFDWSSALVNTPIGFSFAMSFWAVALSFSVGMRWVRELSSAAS